VLPRRPHLEAGEVRDDQLLLASVNGDQEAFDALYRRHAPWLSARLCRRCADEGLVDEVLQDTFVAVWRGAAGWNGRGQVAAWIWGIAVRRLVDAIRCRPSPATPMAELPEDAANRGESAEDQALHRNSFDDAHEALSRLPPELRQVVRATVLDGLTTREASRLLNIPAGTVKTRMMRARRVMREQLT
jgi:RNA polymerase sigma-70 factor, ECF subfamily